MWPGCPGHRVGADAPGMLQVFGWSRRSGGPPHPAESHIATRKSRVAAQSFDWYWVSAKAAAPSAPAQMVVMPEGVVAVERRRARRSARIAPDAFTQQDNQRTRRQHRQCDRRLPPPGGYCPRRRGSGPTHSATTTDAGTVGGRTPAGHQVFRLQPRTPRRRRPHRRPRRRDRRRWRPATPR
jgi:hypothetical protein